jgi:hypothetical protein
MTWTAGSALLLLAVVAAAVLAVWLVWTANRLDRMHHRVDLARAALDTLLQHRSGVALELATSGALDPARSLLLLDAAHVARAEGPGFEHAESELSQALRAVFADDEEVRSLRAEPDVADLVAELGAQCRKVELARRFHNATVETTCALRSRRRVRWFRLTGHAPAPAAVHFDDEPPPGLAEG